jgi:tRNA/rRNA methyltransferase
VLRRSAKAHIIYVNPVDPLRALANTRIVLVRTSHPGNIGAAARAMKTMGLRRLLLVAPKKFPDPVAEARATGALDVLQAAQVCESLEQALAGSTHAVALSARRRELSHQLRSAREAAVELAGRALNGEVALVFGAEISGLSNDEVGLCHELAMIPADPDYSSLNLGSAVQVMAYELRVALFGGDAPMLKKHQVESAGEIAPELARFEDVEHLYRHFEEIMLATGFLNPAQPKRLMPRLRRLFARASLEKEEVNILRGFLSSVNSPKKRKPQ